MYHESYNVELADIATNPLFETEFICAMTERFAQVDYRALRAEIAKAVSFMIINNPDSKFNISDIMGRSFGDRRRVRDEVGHDDVHRTVHHGRQCCSRKVLVRR